MSSRSANALGALADCCWPFERAADALEALARAAGLAPRAVERLSAAVGALDSRDERERFVETTAEALGIGVQAVSESYSGVAEFVERCAPALVLLNADDAPALLAVLRSSSRALVVLAPNGARRRLSAGHLCAALVAPSEAPLTADLAALLGSAGISTKRSGRAYRALLGERLAQAEVELGWLLRAANDRAPSAALYVGAAKALAGVIALYAAQYALMAWAWRCAASGALLGSIDLGWLSAWCLALASTVPLQAALTWRAARLLLDAGSWLRVRMLDGILRQAPPAVRRLGTGQLLSRVLDAGSLDTLGFGGGLLALFAVVDLAMAASLLAAGVAPGALLCLFALLLLAVSFVARRYFVRRRCWTMARLELTHALVERMVGHRTRMVQELPRYRHEGEDALLVEYSEQSNRLDRLTTLFSSIPRLWLLAAFALLSVAFLQGAESKVRMAITLGGVVIASRALSSVSTALGQICSALIAWQHVRSLLSAAPEAELGGSSSQRPSRGSTRLLEARGLMVTVPERSEPLLSDAHLVIREGDAILLQGRSGSGKSSLARVLAGFHPPERGLLLSHGLDRHSAGQSGWSRRVTLVPQFNDNHVLSGSFAFNVLLGRRWPASASELAEAEAVCRELGLGALLDRMPAGMLQMVGETGWQLSHGERSRLFAARALVSGAALVILDESAAALDPESTEVVLACARRRARGLLLIQHP